MGTSSSTSPESTDIELIARYQSTRDLQFVGILFQRYQHLVVGVCMKYLQHREEAHDASMDVFEELIVKLLDLNVMNFRGWLFSVAKNYCLMKLRKVKGISEVDVQDEKIENQFMESADFEHLVSEKQDQSEVLHAAIEQLKDGQRECIRLFYLKELSYKEIADMLQLDLKQVKSNIQNGKRNLQMILGQAFKD